MLAVLVAGGRHGPPVTPIVARAAQVAAAELDDTVRARRPADAVHGLAHQQPVHLVDVALQLLVGAWVGLDGGDEGASARVPDEVRPAAGPALEVRVGASPGLALLLAEPRHAGRGVGRLGDVQQRPRRSALGPHVLREDELLDLLLSAKTEPHPLRSCGPDLRGLVEDLPDTLRALPGPAVAGPQVALEVDVAGAVVALLEDLDRRPAGLRQFLLRGPGVRDASGGIHQAQVVVVAGPRRWVVLDREAPGLRGRHLAHGLRHAAGREPLREIGRLAQRACGSVCNSWLLGSLGEEVDELVVQPCLIRGQAREVLVYGVARFLEADPLEDALLRPGRDVALHAHGPLVLRQVGVAHVPGAAALDLAQLLLVPVRVEDLHQARALEVEALAARGGEQQGPDLALVVVLHELVALAAVLLAGELAERDARLLEALPVGRDARLEPVRVDRGLSARIRVEFLLELLEGAVDLGLGRRRGGLGLEGAGRVRDLARATQEGVQLLRLLLARRQAAADLGGHPRRGLAKDGVVDAELVPGHGHLDVLALHVREPLPAAGVVVDPLPEDVAEAVPGLGVQLRHDAGLHAAEEAVDEARPHLLLQHVLVAEIGPGLWERRRARCDVDQGRDVGRVVVERAASQQQPLLG